MFNNIRITLGRGSISQGCRHLTSRETTEIVDRRRRAACGVHANAMVHDVGRFMVHGPWSIHTTWRMIEWIVDGQAGKRIGSELSTDRLVRGRKK